MDSPKAIRRSCCMAGSILAKEANAASILSGCQFARMRTMYAKDTFSYVYDRKNAFVSEEITTFTMAYV